MVVGASAWLFTLKFLRHCNMVLEGVKEMWTELPKTGKGELLVYENFFNMIFAIKVPSSSFTSFPS